MSSTSTSSYTYTETDIVKVVKRLRADLTIIAQNTGAIDENEAREYAEDIEALAKRGFLKKVDLTLLSDGKEVKAVVYTVNDQGGDLTAANPGGVTWPRVSAPYLRVVLSHTPAYTAQEKEAMRSRLNINWTPSSADLSHTELKAVGGRDYMSNGWAMQRKDYSK